MTIATALAIAFVFNKMEDRMRKNRLKGIISLAFIVLSLLLLYIYLTFGQEILFTKSVLVAVEDIEQGTVIGREYFIEKKIKKEDIIVGSLELKQLSAIIGLASTQYIPGNSQVVSRYFDKPGIVITKDSFVYKIPGDWIYAVPSSIRRSDDILIYEIDAKIDEIMQAPSLYNNKNDSSSEYPDGAVNQSTVESLQGANSLPALRENNNAKIKTSSNEPILEATVIYVKDSANREVVDVDGKPRLDGSSQVSSIEIVCTKKDVAKIEKKIAEGKKLILVYR